LCKPEVIEAVSGGQLWDLFVTLVQKPADIDALIESAVSAQKIETA